MWRTSAKGGIDAMIIILMILRKQQDEKKTISIHSILRSCVDFIPFFESKIVGDGDTNQGISSEIGGCEPRPFFRQ